MPEQLWRLNLRPTGFYSPGKVHLENWRLHAARFKLFAACFTIITWTLLAADQKDYNRDKRHCCLNKVDFIRPRCYFWGHTASSDIVNWMFFGTIVYSKNISWKWTEVSVEVSSKLFYPKSFYKSKRLLPEQHCVAAPRRLLRVVTYCPLVLDLNTYSHVKYMKILQINKETSRHDSGTNPQQTQTWVIWVIRGRNSSGLHKWNAAQEWRKQDTLRLHFDVERPALL
jgi:hypothetical protein